MSTYKAGTVWVDVIPTIKGIDKELRNAFLGPVDQAASNAQGTVAKSLDNGARQGSARVKTVLDQALGQAGKTTGEQLGQDLADGLGKSIPAMRREANQAAQALTSANESVKASTEALTEARKREEAAALAAEHAELDLAAARHSGDPQRIAKAEEQLTAALRQADATARAATKAHTDYRGALVAQERAAAAATAKQEALRAATDRQAQAQAQATKQGHQQATAFGRFTARVTTFGNNVATTARNIVSRVQGAIQPALGKIGTFITNVQSKITSASRTIGSSLSSIGTVALAGVAAGIGAVTAKITSLIPEAVRASDATYKFGATLQFAGLGTEEIENLKKSTQKYADLTVYELADIQNVTAQLASNSVPDYAKLAEAAGNLNAVAGGSAETFKSVGMVMTQTAGAGKLTGENWRQLSDAIPGASGKIQKALLDAGAYSGDFRDAMAKNEISAEEFYDAVKVLGLTDIAYETAMSTKTFEGAMGNLDSTIVRGWVQVLEAIKTPLTGLINASASLVEPLFNALERGAKRVAPWIERLGMGLQAVADGKVDLKQTLSGILPVLGVIAGPLGAKAAEFIGRIPLVGGALGGLIRMVTGPIGLVVTLIISMITRSEALRTALWGAFTKIGEAINSVLPAGQQVGGVFDAIGFVAGKLGDFLAPVVDWLGEIIALGVKLAGAGIATAFEYIAWGAQAASEWISGVLVPSIKGVWTILSAGDFTGSIFGFGEDSTVVDYLLTIRESAISVWQWLSGTFVPGIQSLGKLLFEGDYDGNLFGLSEDSFLVDFLLDLRDIVIMVADTLVQIWEGVIAPTFTTIGAHISSIWHGVVKPVFDLVWTYVSTILAPVLLWLWENVVSPVFSAIALVVGTCIGIVVTVLKGVWWFISNVLAPTVSWLYNTIFLPVFSSIQTVVSVVISAVSISLQVFIAVLGKVGSWISNLWTQYVSPVFTWIGDKISTVIGIVQKTILPPFETAIDKLGKAFTVFKSVVSQAMESIRSAAAQPINFVINTVYNNGIKKAFDSIAESVGISTRMPYVQPIAGYANGGVLPGYTPGRDVHVFTSPTGGVLHLSGGEGIIRPDSLRALGGKAWLDRVNASRGRGLASVGDLGSVQRFAEGGIWGGVKSFASSAWNAAVSAADFIGDVLSDPAGAIVNLVQAPAQALLASMSSSMWAKIAKNVPSMLWDGITSLFVSKANEVGGGGQALVNAARQAIGVPYVWGGSSIPPGLDCSGLVYWSHRQLSKDIARLTAAGYQNQAVSVPWNKKRPGDLLFWGNPAWHVAINAGNGQMVEAPRPGANVLETSIWGSPSVGRLYDQGGFLPPGVTHVVNKTGRPEAVLTADQWSAIKQIAATRPAQGRTNVRLVVSDNKAFDGYIEDLAGGVVEREATEISRVSLHDHLGV